MSNILAISYEDVIAVTASDSAPQFGTKPAAGFMVTTAGTIKIKTQRGSTPTLTVNAGVIYPIAITQVFSTGTSGVGNIFALMALPYGAIQ
jgi:hypothetical protein